MRYLQRTATDQEWNQLIGEKYVAVSEAGRAELSKPLASDRTYRIFSVPCWASVFDFLTMVPFHVLNGNVFSGPLFVWSVQFAFWLLLLQGLRLRGCLESQKSL